MFERYKFTLLTFLLAIVLLIPYGLKLLSSSLEPYPAILFPSGAAQVRGNQDSFEFETINLYCFDLNSEAWKPQDTSSFLSPIPNHFFGAVVKNEFGLNPDLEYTVKSRKSLIPRFSYQNAKALSAVNINQAKAWLRDRLAAHGCSDSSLLIRKKLMLADLNDRSVSEIKIISEKRYEL